MLVAEGLTKSYGDRDAVRDVTLRLEPGRILGLVGVNGAGKTTTIKMLAGLVAPTRGEATLDGAPTLRPEARRRLGYLPEDSPLYEEETARSYLGFFGALYDLPRAAARDRAERLLDRLGLAPEHRRRPLGTLSKGMRRKVSVARCLLHEPPVLLLDEPTSGLDPGTTGELERFLAELRRDGTAVLLSAHNLPQVEKLCDEIVVLHGGRVVERGTLDELRHRHPAPGYRVRATVAFPGSHASGTSHVADPVPTARVQDALDAIRRAGGEILTVEAMTPTLEEILRSHPPVEA